MVSIEKTRMDLIYLSVLNIAYVDTVTVTEHCIPAGNLRVIGFKSLHVDLLFGESFFCEGKCFAVYLVYGR